VGRGAAAIQGMAWRHRLQGSSPQPIFSMICRPAAKMGRVELLFQPGAACIGRHGQHLEGILCLLVGRIQVFLAWQQVLVPVENCWREKSL
jgi:hypothetical protein